MGERSIAAVAVGSKVVEIEEFPLPEEPWVVMTGGGYFFTPPISALSGALAE